MVELMVAITLALLLTGAVISVFIGSRTAYQATAGVGDMADSGRFALNLIGESVRNAGHLACNSATSATNVSLLGATTFQNNYGQGITGFEANGTGPGTAIALPAVPAAGAAGNWTPALDGTITGAIPGPGNLGAPVLGSDVLVVYSSTPRVVPLYTTADVAAGATTLAVTALPAPPAPAITANQYAAIADCTKSMIFQVGGVGPGSVNIKNASLTLAFAAGAVVTPLATTVYYIGVGSDGDSSLWRLEQVNGPGFTPPGAEELVPDVENMQLLYGIDPAGTQTASAYVTADQIGAFNVASIQVALLVASPPANKPVPPPPAFNMVGTPPAQVTVPGDNRSRQVFYATINLRNAVN
jgi:type IV pilus assembly protein PilW